MGRLRPRRELAAPPGGTAGGRSKPRPASAGRSRPRRPLAAAAFALGAAGLLSPPPAAGQDTGVPAGDGAAGRFGFGRPATAEEISAWDIDVRPDGTGLPEGEGTAASGAPIYARQCAVCHGRSGEGGVADRLVGYAPESTPPFGPRYERWRGDSPDVPYSVGNYWPYATTLFDYVRRAMPTNAPGMLEAGEVYGLVAWILAENGIIAADEVLNAATLPAVEMPARGVFVPRER